MSHPFARPVACLALLLASCAGVPTPPVEAAPTTIQPRFPGKRPSRSEAAAAFDSQGVQPGQRLPELSLVDLEGRPVAVADLHAGRPLLLTTCSLTCNIARRQQAQVNDLRARWGDTVAVVMVYTIDAHPTGDPCPYTGEEWVPPDNGAVPVGQPKDLDRRRELARRFARDWAGTTPVLVDTMDNASWRSLGEAPNVGLAIDRDGIVLCRCGWFDAAPLAAAIEGALLRN